MPTKLELQIRRYTAIIAGQLRCPNYTSGTNPEFSYCLSPSCECERIARTLISQDSNRPTTSTEPQKEVQNG